MTKDAEKRAAIHAERVRAELLDRFDEELEEEIDDQRLASLLDDAAEHPQISGLSRSFYFKEL